jgi:hypothetical protein
MATLDERVGQVQEHLQQLLCQWCTDLDLPVHLLFLGRVEQVAGFYNSHARVVYIDKDDSLEEQLASLYHEFCHILIAYGSFGEDMRLIQAWYDAHPLLYRALYNSSLCVHESLARRFELSLGEDAVVPQSCRKLRVFLNNWDKKPELLFQTIPETRDIPSIVEAVQCTFGEK